MYAHGSRGERPAFSLASITFTLRMHPLFKTPRLKAYRSLASITFTLRMHPLFKTPRL
jgi:hypothetical protein